MKVHLLVSALALSFLVASVLIAPSNALNVRRMALATRAKGCVGEDGGCNHKVVVSGWSNAGNNEKQPVGNSDAAAAEESGAAESGAEEGSEETIPSAGEGSDEGSEDAGEEGSVEDEGMAEKLSGHVYHTTTTTKVTKHGTTTTTVSKPVGAGAGAGAGAEDSADGEESSEESSDCANKQKSGCVKFVGEDDKKDESLPAVNEVIGPIDSWLQKFTKKNDLWNLHNVAMDSVKPLLHQMRRSQDYALAKMKIEDEYLRDKVGDAGTKHVFGLLRNHLNGKLKDKVSETKDDPAPVVEQLKRALLGKKKE